MKSQENLKKYKYMRAALKEAQKAEKENEVPVGAVVVFEDKIIARAYNKREQKQEFHSHAEFLAMMKASKKIGSWRLENCDVYVTLEPCPMCAGAMIQSRIKNLYYAADDPKSGVAKSIIEMFNLPFNHKINVESGILANESQELLENFFKRLRKK
ncbi:MAG: tRNA adenosine(34) deaminase TadA [Tenericutes bacterium]|nr:tRNA adenosine(34) deaminase TadA [Mycoplasmatota bacterium]